MSESAGFLFASSTEIDIKTNKQINDVDGVWTGKHFADARTREAQLVQHRTMTQQVLVVSVCHSLGAGFVFVRKLTDGQGSSEQRLRSF